MTGDWRACVYLGLEVGLNFRIRRRFSLFLVQEIRNVNFRTVVVQY